jgi:hypothetical protein
VNPIARYPSHAQPGGAWHTRSTAMHVFPQAFPLWQVRQHDACGARSGRDGTLQDLGSSDGVPALTSVSHDVDRPSMTHSESPELTSCSGWRGRSGATAPGFTGSDSTGADSGSAAPPRPRHPDSSAVSTMTAVNPRMTRWPSDRTEPGRNSPRVATLGSVLTMLLSLAACGGVNTGQSLEVPAPPEALLGHGFDSLSGLTRGVCIDSRPVDRLERRGANTVTQVFYARSKEEIIREIGFSGGVSFGLSGFGLNLGFEALDRDAQQSTTTFAVIRIQIETPSETLRDYRLGDHAVQTLRREGAGKFYEKCGDGFVTAIRQGGFFLGIVALDTIANEDVKRVSGNAGVSFLGIGVQGGASSEARAFLEKHRARYYIIQNGGDPGGWASVKQLETIDHLLQRAQRFEHSVASGMSVPTRLVVRPYQVASNLPRKASLWNVIEQSRFLDELAVQYGEVKRASAELHDKLATTTCTNRREAKELEQLKTRYTAQITAIQQRAQDCLNDPQRRCTDHRLDTVDARAHQAALELCKTSPGILGTFRTEPPRPTRQPGKDTECKLWQLSSISAQTSANAPRENGSQLDTSILLWVDNKKISVASPVVSATNLPLKDVYAKPGAQTLVRVWSGPLFKAVMSKTWQEFTDRLPATLPRGTWTLEMGQTRVVFQTRCVE